MDGAQRQPPPSASSAGRGGGGGGGQSGRVQQPKPQALPSRQGPSSILVSPRQKGNPILNQIQSVPWEYSDIPADYVLGTTTCALFLSLKYHRLHPEYIYSRIRALAGKYRLRVLLTMVDVDNHEDPLKELSKTSLINNLTLILCWSAAEAGRYLSLFKTYEHASPTSIRAQQATSYSDKLVEFVTSPRSINKTDAISLVGNFGSLRAAMNAHPEEIAMLGGWGDKKVANWSSSVRDGFRVKKAKKRGGVSHLNREVTRNDLSREDSRLGGDNDGAEQADEDALARKRVGRPIGMIPSREATRASATPDPDRRAPQRPAEEVGMTRGTEEDLPLWEPGSDEEDALMALADAERAAETDRDRPLPAKTKPGQAPSNHSIGGAEKRQSESVGEGIMAALAKLREKG